MCPTLTLPKVAWSDPAMQRAPTIVVAAVDHQLVLRHRPFQRNAHMILGLIKGQKVHMVWYFIIVLINSFRRWANKKTCGYLPARRHPIRASSGEDPEAVAKVTLGHEQLE